MTNSVTIGQIAHVLRCHEQSVRSYLHEVNRNIRPGRTNYGEPVDLHTLYLLWKRHQDTPLGRRLIPLLQAS